MARVGREAEAGAPPAAVAPGRSTGLWAPSLRVLTLGLALTVTLVAFEALSITTVMPVVAREFKGLELYGWVFSAFFLGNLVGIVVAGQEADRYGLRLPFLAGLALFAAGLVVGGLSPSMPVLVVGRAIQGLGAGAIPTVAYVAIGRAYPDVLRPRMFAVMSTAWVVPGLVGPALAGLVADHFTWRAVFLGLLPLVAAAAAMTAPVLARAGGIASAGRAEATGDASSETSAPRARQVVPALLTAVGAGLFLAGLSGEGLIGLAVAAAGLALGLPALRRLVPPGTLTARPGLPVTVLLRGVQTFAFSGAEVFLPLTLVQVRGESATFAGLALTSATVAWAIGAWIQARFVPIWGPRRLIRLGYACLAAGIAGTASVLLPTTPVVVGIAGWGLAGLGMGLSYAVISLTVIREAAPGQEGAATAGMQLCDVLGTALGTGLGGALIDLGLTAGWEPHLSLGVAFSVAALVALGALALTPRLRGGSLS